MPAVAFALPILPGQEENVRFMSEEVLRPGPLREAYEESRRNLGISREMAWLQQTPVGDMLIVYWESDDPQYVLREMAASQDQFDSRFRQFIESSGPAIRPRPGATSLQQPALRLAGRLTRRSRLLGVRLRRYETRLEDVAPKVGDEGTHSANQRRFAPQKAGY